jgi:hypothetical protein
MDAITTVRALDALLEKLEAEPSADWEEISQLRREREIADDRRLREHYEHAHQARYDRDEYDLY